MITVPVTKAFAAITVGEALPPQEHTPTSRSLVRYTAAAGDYYEPHYDLQAAKDANLPGVIVHGLLKAAWLVQVVTAWAGSDAAVIDVDISYRGMDFVDEPYVVAGRVAEIDEASRTVQIHAWGENQRDEQTTTGVITLQFP